MESNKVEELLDKYFEGSSNVEEENSLRRYFQQENVAVHLLKYRGLFGYFIEAQQQNLESNIVLPELEKPKKNYRFLISIAASVLILVGTGIFTFTTYSSTNQEDLGTFDDPVIALKETQKALSLLSKHVNTGYQSVQYIDEYAITRDKIFNVEYIN